MRCVSKDVCVDMCVSKVTKNVGHMLPHTLGDCRSVSLTTGAGKVSTLLADGDWLSPFFPSSQSTADLRHCFNHSSYGSVAQQATPYPPHAVSRYLPRPLTPLSLTSRDALACTLQHMYTYMCIGSAHKWDIPAGSCSKYSISLEYAAKLPAGVKELLKEGQVRMAVHLNSWGQLGVCAFVHIGCISIFISNECFYFW